jgi:hypothetical protein
MVTLHAYILRELLKTFALAVVVVSAVFMLGGGIFSVLTKEGVTARDTVRFLPLLIPAILTLSMPIAALFTATIVYGRFAADNEFVACRSAGINIHRLLLPAALLALFVAISTGISINYVIPGFLGRIAHYARKNIGEIAAAKLKTQGYVSYKGWYVTAEDAELKSDAYVAERGLETGSGLTHLAVTWPTLLELREEEPVRYMTAEWGLCTFDTRGPMVSVTLRVGNAREFDIGRRLVQLGRQTIQMPVPIPLPMEPAFADLTTLFEWTRRPWLFDDDKVGGAIDVFMSELLRRRFNLSCIEQLEREPPLVLLDESGERYEIAAASQKLSDTGRPELTGARVVWTRPHLDKPIRYEAARAEIIARPLPGLDATVELRLIRTPEQPVLEYNPRAEDYSVPIEHSTISLDRLVLPEEIRAERSDYTREMVASDAATPVELTDEMENSRIGLQRAVEKFRRKVGALIHFRLGVCGNVLVAIVMGAILGVMFRGSHMLVAFGLSVVPGAIAVILLVMGKQLGEHQGAESVGRFVTWGGMAALAAADLIILRLGVRR